MDFGAGVFSYKFPQSRTKRRRKKKKKKKEEEEEEEEEGILFFLLLCLFFKESTLELSVTALNILPYPRAIMELPTEMFVFPAKLNLKLDMMLVT